MRLAALARTDLVRIAGIVGAVAGTVSKAPSPELGGVGAVAAGLAAPRVRAVGVAGRVVRGAPERREQGEER